MHGAGQHWQGREGRHVMSRDADPFGSERIGEIPGSMMQGDRHLMPGFLQFGDGGFDVFVGFPEDLRPVARLADCVV